MAGTTTPKKRAPRAAKVQDAAEVAADAAEANGLVDGLTTEDIAELEKKYAPVDEKGVIHPVEIGKSGRRPNSLIHIFTLDGEKFYVPEKPSAAVMVRFLKDARNKRIGRRVAVENLLCDVLGEENLAALSASNEVDDEDVAHVFHICAHIAFGNVKEMIDRAGESSRGSRT